MGGGGNSKFFGGMCLPRPPLGDATDYIHSSNIIFKKESNLAGIAFVPEWKPSPAKNLRKYKHILRMSS